MFYDRQVDNSRQGDSAKNVIQRLTEENERLGSEIKKIMKKLKDAEHEIKKETIDTEMKRQQVDNKYIFHKLALMCFYNRQSCPEDIVVV